MTNEQIEIAAGFSSRLNEDHAKALVKEMVPALQDFEDFRQRVKEIVEESYPERIGEFVKAFKKVDSAIAEVEKLVNKL